MISFCNTQTVIALCFRQIGLLMVLCNFTVLTRAFEGENFSAFNSSYPTLVPVVVIGSGPAGLAASLYVARSKIYTVVVAGMEPGGQLMGSSYVENMPGVPADQGYKIIQSMEQQANQAGVKFLDDVIESIEVDSAQDFFILRTEQGEQLHALAVIIATGASAKRLDIPGEERYMSRGIYTCAVCDCRQADNKRVVVIGGGDAAVESVMHLAPYAQHITMLVRGDQMKASLTMQEKLQKYSRVMVQYHTRVIEFMGDGEDLTGAMIEKNSGEKSLLPIDCAYIAIGHIPNTALFSSLVKLDAQGYIELKDRSQETSYPGIFAAGDVADSLYKQAGSASGYGIGAALDAIAYLRKKGFSHGIARDLAPFYFKNVR